MTIEQIENLTYEQCIDVLLERLNIIPTIDENGDTIFPSKITIGEETKSVIEWLVQEFEIYKQELLDSENARLEAIRIENERIANLNGRFQTLYLKDCGMPGFHKHYNEANVLWFFNEKVMKEWDAVAQETFVALLESEEVSFSRESKLANIRVQRNALLENADILINKAFDLDSENLSDLKAYRESLRNFTESFKADMSLLDAVDLNNVNFPTI